MNIIVRSIAAFTLAAFAAGPISVAAAPNAPQTLGAETSNAQAGIVTGAVVDQTGVPVAGAVVTLRGATPLKTTTDDKGLFALTSVPAGVYVLTSSKPGYETAAESDFVVARGQTQTVAITMSAASFSSLRTIATVRSASRGTFNTSTASVNVVNSEAFLDQATPQVTRVLNEIPGVQISLPSGSANAAVPGAITFPNIRGALSYETASLIDGHPLSVGKYGDYVTTFLNSFMFDNVEVVKGPGAMAPEVNYAIGGTVNFRTKDPTLLPTADYTIGYSNHGGSFYNFGVSDTVLDGRLGFVADIAGMDDPSALNGAQVHYSPVGDHSSAVCPAGTPPGTGCTTFFTSAGWDKALPIPGTSSKYYNSWGTVACCYTLYGEYNNMSELLKLRYKLSDATTVTTSYLGSQTTANQNGNTSSLTPSLFQPLPIYSGTSMAVNSQFLMSSAHPGNQEVETNNEPMLQTEISTTLGRDTLLGRFYHAGIQRIINRGNNINTPVLVNDQIWGTGPDASGNIVSYNGTRVPLYYYDFYNQNEIDSLTGYSLQFNHPFGGNNSLTLAWDHTQSQTRTGTLSSDDAYQSSPSPVQLDQPYWSSVLPTGSGQIFDTFLVRDHVVMNDKLDAAASIYVNEYNSTFPVASPAPASSLASSSQPAPDQAGWLFNSNKTSHFDERVGVTYRVNPSAIARFSAGSAIAPPYINLLSTVPGTISVGGNGIATQNINSGTLKPETAFGYDLGADVRLWDRQTYFTGDVYLTNLFNGFIQQTVDAGQCKPDMSVKCNVAPLPELYQTGYVNLSNARFEGIEAQLRHIPEIGLNWRAQAGLQKGYAYNLPPCFYSKTAGQCTYDTLLAVVPGANFTGGALNAPSTFTGFSNQSLPYLTANAEISYKWASGAYAAFGGTFYGKNNSAYEPPFTIAYASVRVPLSDQLALQITGDNIFNSYSGLFPIVGAGQPIALANGGLGATTGNVFGPSTWRFVLTKAIGAQVRDNGRTRDSSR